MKSRTNGVVRSCIRAITVACALGTVTAAQASFIASVDRLTITKNGNAFFQDTFSDGIAPPSAPNFANGTPGSYQVFGPAGTEAGGKYMVNSANGTINTFADGSVRRHHHIWLNSNTNPADTILGLKPNHTFVYQGLFDLVSTTGARDSYGIAFNDTTGTGSSTIGQTLSVSVGRNPSGFERISMGFQDFAANISTSLFTAPLDYGHDQILFQLERASTTSNDVVGSYQYWDGGAASTGFFTLGTGTIFNVQQWTRAEMFVNEVTAAPVPLPAAGWLLLSALGLFGAVGVRRRT